MRNVMYAFWDENLCVSKTVCAPLPRGRMDYGHMLLRNWSWKVAAMLIPDRRRVGVCRHRVTYNGGLVFEREVSFHDLMTMKCEAQP